MSALGQKQTCAVQEPMSVKGISVEAHPRGSCLRRLGLRKSGLFKLLARARHLQAGKQLNVTLRARSIALE
jgi:hypothetical protein